MMALMMLALAFALGGLVVWTFMERESTKDAMTDEAMRYRVDEPGAALLTTNTAYLFTVSAEEQLTALDPMLYCVGLWAKETNAREKTLEPGKYTASIQVRVLLKRKS
jgi:hypothetical protein